MSDTIDKGLLPVAADLADPQPLEPRYLGHVCDYCGAEGEAPHAQLPLSIIACEACRPELEAIAAQRGWRHVQQEIVRPAFEERERRRGRAS